MSAVLAFLLAAITLYRPRSGWGRLLLFIPKLFWGSFILLPGIAGGIAAIGGYLIGRDPVSSVFGALALIISGRHVYRIYKGAAGVVREISKSKPQSTGEIDIDNKSLFWLLLRGDRHQYDFTRDIQIGLHAETGRPILTDLWSPAAEVAHSGMGIIYLHGSGWHYADKDFGTRPFFRRLASSGHVIADLAYTLSPETDMFGMLADVKRSICWMKENSEEFNFRKDRIVLMGGSAGGHLALLAAYTPDHPVLDPPDAACSTEVRAVVSYYGPTDLEAQFRSFEELPGLEGSTRFERWMMKYLESRVGFEVIPVHRLLPAAMGGEPSEAPDLYELASPLNHISQHCPPTLLLQGSHDFSGVASDVRHMHQALRSSGCTAFLFELPDTEHGFDLFRPRWSPAAIAATNVTCYFLEAFD
jgi:acetyl esterase/lipase